MFWRCKPRKTSLSLAPEAAKRALRINSMAHKKGGGSSVNGRDSHGQRLGVKRFGGQLVTGGSILVRQRGTHYKPGLNVGFAKEDSFFSLIDGIVLFEDKGGHGRY